MADDDYDWQNQRGLNEFEDGDGSEPPRIKKRNKVSVTVGERRKTAGWTGPTNRGEYGFVSVRNSHEHRIRALDAYAISMTVLHKLVDKHVKVVLVVESDTGDVYEYRLKQFAGEEQTVPEEFQMTEDDPQRYVERRNRHRFWSDHKSDVYVPRDASV